MEFYFTLTLTAGPSTTSFSNTLRWTKGTPTEAELFTFIYQDCLKAFRDTWDMPTVEPLIMLYRCVPNKIETNERLILSWD